MWASVGGGRPAPPSRTAEGVLAELPRCPRRGRRLVQKLCGRCWLTRSSALALPMGWDLCRSRAAWQKPPKRLHFHSCHNHSPCQHQCRHGRLSFGSESTFGIPSKRSFGGRGPSPPEGGACPYAPEVGSITWWWAGRLPGRWHPRRGRRGGRRL